MNNNRKHRVMVHPTKYNAKPTNYGTIQDTIFCKENHKELTIKEIASIWCAGQTIKPGHFIDKGKNGYVDASNTLLVLDVDNKYFEVVDGKKVCRYTHYTIDDAINMCEALNLPIALIYTSFNYTDECHKFRIVFQLDRGVSISEWEQCLTVLKELIPIADKQVSLGHYLFGGHNLVLLDENAVLNVDELLKNAVSVKIERKKRPQSLDGTAFGGKSILNPQSYTCNNKQVIDCGFKMESGENPYVSKLREHFLSEIFTEYVKKLGDKEFKTTWSAIQYIQSLPLNEILGVNEKTSCLLHEDNKPSAGFFLAADGAWHYKCFSCGVVYEITDFIEFAFGLDKKQDWNAVSDKAIELFNLKIVKDKWISHCQSFFFNNEMVFSKADKYKEQFPKTAAGLKFTDSVYMIILREAKVALEYKSAKDVNGYPLVSVSMRYLQERTGLNFEKVKNRRQRLLNMGIIRVLSDEEAKAVSDDLYDASIVKGEKDKNSISTYVIYPIDLQKLEESENRLNRFKEVGATAKGATARQSLAIYNGEDNTFIKAKGDSPKVAKDRAVLMEWARVTLLRKKCFLKQDYLAYAKKKGYGEKYASSFVAEIVASYGLKRAVVTSEMIKKYGLSKSAMKKVIFHN